MRELFTITGSTQAAPRRWPRAGMPVAVALGLLLLALAGCERAIEPGEGYSVGTGGSSHSATVVITPGENPGAPPAVAGDPSSVESPSRVTIESLVRYVGRGGTLRFRLNADPAPASPLKVVLLWADPEHVLAERPATVTIPTSGTVDFAVATKPNTGSLGSDHIAYVYVTIIRRAHYTVGIPTLGVSVRAPEADSLVSIAASPLSVDEGEPVTFTVTAVPPPASPLTVKLNWQHDHRFAEPAPQTVAVPTSGTVSFTLATNDDLIDNYGGDLVGVSIGGGNSGDGYGPGWPATATITVVDDEITSRVAVLADSTSVQEGDNLSFTLTADPAPLFDLTVNLGWTLRRTSAEGVAHTVGDLPDTVTIPTSGTATVVVATTDDAVRNGPRRYNASTHVDVAILKGVNYFGTYSTARITILDNDRR